LDLGKIKILYPQNYLTSTAMHVIIRALKEGQPEWASNSRAYERDTWLLHHQKHLSIWLLNCRFYIFFH